jgi:hypothetical protein
MAAWMPVLPGLTNAESVCAEIMPKKSSCTNSCDGDQHLSRFSR